MAALSEIEKLEARWAENPDGRYFAPLADAYRKAGRVDDAIQVVTAGLNKHPDYLSAHIVLGRCFLEKKDDLNAAQAFERVLTLDTENIIALKSLAEIAERTGNVPAARGWLQRLLVVDAMNTDAAEDLERLGGPIEEEAKPAEEEPTPAISFMDLSEPAPAAEEAPAPRLSLDEASIPKTMERPAAKLEPPPPPPPEPVKEPEPAPMLELEPTSQGVELSMGGQDAGPPLELEHASFQPPEDMPAPPVPGDVVPFDDQLAWGAGERTSQAISPEDMQAAEERHEAPAPAIEFMGSGEPTPGRSSESDIPSPITGVDPNSSTLPIESVPPPPGWGAPVGPTAEAATIEMPPVRIPEPEPEPAAMAAPEPMPEQAPAPEAEMSSMSVEDAMAETTAPGAAELPLIMPEDVTPAEEMRRPSAKLVQMVSPEPEHEGGESGEPMVTETMGDLYLKQGFKDQAADVYRRLLDQRPGDAGLKAKLSALEAPVKMSATAMGTEAVGAWLKRIARAQLHVGAAAPPPAAPEPGPTPMEQAFATSEPEPEAAPAPQAVEAEPATQGAPARQATDQYSLDQIFGGQGGGSASAPREPSSQAHTLGASFDEFFGSTQKQETVRPKEGGGGRQSEDDLSAFNAWLHGLKR